MWALSNMIGCEKYVGRYPRFAREFYSGLCVVVRYERTCKRPELTRSKRLRDRGLRMDAVEPMERTGEELYIALDARGSQALGVRGALS